MVNPSSSEQTELPLAIVRKLRPRRSCKTPGFGRAFLSGRPPRVIRSTHVIDTPCHLTFPDFEGRIPAVLDEAGSHGVTGAITVSTTTHDCLDALAIARRFKNVWCTAAFTRCIPTRARTPGEA